MKKIFQILFLIVAFSSIGFSQQLIQSFNFSTAEAKDSINVSTRGFNYYKLQWSIRGSGALSACTVLLQTSPNNSTWSTGISGTCTSSDESAVTQISTSYVRLNTTAFTSTLTGTELVVNIQFFTSISSVDTTGLAQETGGNLATIVTNTNDLDANTDGIETLLTSLDGKITAVTDPCNGQVLTNKHYITAGSSDNESQVSASPITLCAISGRNVHATNNAFIRCTNATAANTTPGSTAVVFEAMFPAGGSSYIDNHIDIAFSTAATCYVVTGKAETDATDAAADDVVYELRYK